MNFNGILLVVDKWKEIKDDSPDQKAASKGLAFTQFIHTSVRCNLTTHNERSHKEQPWGDPNKKKVPPTQHLFFADDSLFLIKGTPQNAQSLLTIIDTYCTASGQGVNISNANLYVSLNAREDDKQAI